MTDARAAAEWMAAQVTEDPVRPLSQREAVLYIAQNFSTDLLYRNKNDNPAIADAVLEIFRELTDGTVVWVRGGRFWRPRHEDDPVGKRQAY